MPLVIAVRLRNNPTQLWFDPMSCHPAEGDHVVVRTARGVEMGLACSDPFSVEGNELRAPLQPVIRVATEEDFVLADGLAARGAEALPVFREYADRHDLNMKPVSVEFLFEGDKAVFYFSSEERVDFRDLVRELAGRFHIRVDMRQIGVRDEARIVGGIAHCGQELCCARMGGEFQPVSIRMAKEQDLPLNPIKISGLCGRLMCCLRYEFTAYKDFKTRAPKRGGLIETPLGLAKVTGFDTPREIIDLRLEDGTSLHIPLKEMGYEDGTVAGDYEDRAASTDTDDATAPLRKDVPAEKPCCPGRPCRVSREVLDLHADTALSMALANYDREHGLSAPTELDDLLITDSSSRNARENHKPHHRRTSEVSKDGGDGTGQEVAPNKGASGEPSEKGDPQRRSRRRRVGAIRTDEHTGTHDVSATQDPSGDMKSGRTRQENSKRREPTRREPVRRETPRRDGESARPDQSASPSNKPRPGRNSSALRHPTGPTTTPPVSRPDGHSGPDEHRRRRRRGGQKGPGDGQQGSTPTKPTGQ